MRAIIKWVMVLVAAGILGVTAWLGIAPPELIRVGTGYSAKTVCSNVFVAGRDPGEVMAVDVQGPGHPLLKLMRVDVDRTAKTASVALLGLFGRSTAVARDGLGCTSIQNGNASALAHASVPALAKPAPDALWPEGDRVDSTQNPAVAAILDDAALTGPGMRAIVVVKNGRVVAERYSDGFSDKTPLLGWSMTKTVTAAIIGTLVKSGKMDVNAKGLFEPWKADGRAAISLADLMAMSSGLEFNEDYGAVADVTRMLFLDPDMGGFASGKPLTGTAGGSFSYSSGTTVILSKLWQEAVGAEALGYPNQALFGPLGMSSAVLEADATGTYVGSSYLYATARDWARFGQFMVQKGVWNGQEILPAGFVDWMTEIAPASKGTYGRGQLWLEGPLDRANTDKEIGLPADTFWALGHDGQSIAMIPSQNMVVVRLGLTPSKLGWGPEKMIAALVKALE